MANDETTRVFRRTRNDESSDTKTTNPLFNKNNVTGFGADGDGDTKIFRPSSKSPDGNLASDNLSTSMISDVHSRYWESI